MEQPIYILCQTKDQTNIVITFSNYKHRENGYGLKYITSGTEYDILLDKANTLNTRIRLKNKLKDLDKL